MPEHPRALPHGYVLRHLLVAEKALGRPIPLGVEVHHVNENKKDDRGCNLVICENRTYHVLLHRRMAAFKAVGIPHALKCKYCKLWGTNLRSYSRTAPHHPQCHRDALTTARRKHELSQKL